MKLITLALPIAFKLPDNTLLFSRSFEAEIVTPQLPTNIPVGFTRLHIYKVFDSKTQDIVNLPQVIRVTVKESRICSLQEQV
jgi:hypothetical protein